MRRQGQTTTANQKITPNIGGPLGDLGGDFLGLELDERLLDDRRTENLGDPFQVTFFLRTELWRRGCRLGDQGFAFLWPGCLPGEDQSPDDEHQ